MAKIFLCLSLLIFANAENTGYNRFAAGRNIEKLEPENTQNAKIENFNNMLKYINGKTDQREENWNIPTISGPKKPTGKNRPNNRRFKLYTKYMKKIY